MIGLLTFHDTTNFGSLLQTYGLYKKIIDLGYGCHVIDYQCDSIVAREIPKPLHFSWNLKKFAKDVYFGGLKRKKYKELSRFLHNNIQLSSRCDKYIITQIKDSYDKFVIGSDITWGMDIIDSDLTYFLNFESNKSKKTAFSSSIGNPWSEQDKALIKPFLNDFDYIAVREEESADWVKELTGKRPNVVCDPTMLLTGSEWLKFTEKSSDNGKYVLVYFDTNNEDCLKNAKIYAKRHNLKVKLIGYERKRNDVEVVRPLSLEQFLSLINNAAFIVTASYHGMLFSVYFNKQFAYFNRAHKSRMNTLASKLKVTDREGADNNILQMGKIDYTKVNQAVDEYRNYSVNCLKELLGR